MCFIVLQCYSPNPLCAWAKLSQTEIYDAFPGLARRIAFVDVLEQGGTLLRVKRTVVGGGQGVEHILDGQLEWRAGGCPLPQPRNGNLIVALRLTILDPQLFCRRYC